MRNFILLALFSAFAITGCKKDETEPVRVSEIKLNKTTLTLIIGQAETLTATVYPDNAENKTVTWSSSAKSVAAIDDKGRVSAVSEGTATITAACGGKTAACTVTVTPVKAEKITLNKTELSLFVGKEDVLTAAIAPENVTDKTVAWNSDKPGIASVDDNGKVRAIAPGTAVITAACSGAHATCTVTVMPPVEAERVTLNKTQLSLAVGKEESLTATILPDNTTDKTVVWSSDKPEIATVDENGRITGIALGTATITATCGKVSEKCSVTIFLLGTAGSLIWQLTPDGELSITGSGAMPDYYLTIENVSTAPWQQYRTKIKSVMIGNGITSIGNYAFDGCYYLASVTISNDVKTIGSHAFDSCRTLPELSIPYGVTTIGDYGIAHCDKLTKVSIAESVTTIGDDAFAGCSVLPEISFPNSVTTIGRGAFTSCIGLTSVTIPENVETIGIGAFSFCSKLTNIEVVAGNQHFASEDGVLFDKSKESLLIFPCGRSGSYTIPNSVTIIEEAAFDSCEKLTDLVIPNGVTIIKMNAFSRCSGLTTVTIPESVEMIEGFAFDCSGLKNVTIMAKVPPYLDSYNFTVSDDTLYVPKGCVSAYKAMQGWNDSFTNIVEQQE